MGVKTYRIVEVSETGAGRQEKVLDPEWKREKVVKDELRALKLKHPNRWLSIQANPLN